METRIATCLSASGDQRQSALQAMLPDLKRLAAAHPDEARNALRRLALPDLDYSTLEALTRIHATLRKAQPPETPRKIAVLGTFTTHQLVSLLDYFLWAAG